MPDYSLTRNTPQAPPQQFPISQLSQASQQAKLETENALLREALAMSAQNCEALMKQSNQSLAQINQNVGKWIEWLKKETEKSQQQLKQLENMNETFSKKLSDVLTHTHGRLAKQLKNDVEIALQSNIQAMENNVRKMEQAVDRVTAYEKSLKASLDKRIKSYRESIHQLFKLNDWREMLFWLGMSGAILTPIALLLNWFL